MQTCDVIFFRAEDTWLSRMISKFTKFPYTHVAIAIDAKHIIEANRFIKTRVIPFEVDTKLHTVYRLPDLDAETKIAIREKLLSFAGFPYDYGQVFSWIVQLFFKWDRTLFNRTNKLICSELIDYAFIGNVPRTKSDRIGDLTPSLLLDYYDLREVTENVN